MNILQIVPQLNVGGVETGTVDLAKYLVKSGHKCFVVSSGGGLEEELRQVGVKHFRLPVDKKAFWIMFKAAAEVAAIIEREKIDIVHARSRVPAWVGFMACRRTNTVLVTTAHGHYSRHIFSYIMGSGKYTIVPSSIIGKHMYCDFGVPLENIRKIPRSVDLSRYAFKPKQRKSKEFVVGVIGRIAPIKGQLYFIKALARILKSAPYVKALIVGGVSPGKDNYMEELEVWTRRLGLSDALSFLGNRRDIPQVLEKLDALVMPSISEESFGRVIVEAQASGVPVVACRVGGIVEIIEDSKDGLLVFPKDDEGIAQAVLKLIHDPGLCSSLSAAGRKKVEEKYTLEKMAEATLAVYSEALEKQRILVIKLGAPGDVVLATPSLKAIKRKFPQARLVCLTGIASAEILARCPFIDELITFDPKGKDKGTKALFRLALKLLSRRFDAVVDLQNNKLSHFLSYCTMSSRRYGYDNGKWGFLLNRRIKGAKDRLPPVEHQFRVLKMLGIDSAGETLELWPSDEDRKFAENFLKVNSKGTGKIIGINIGASRRWESKRWIAPRFAALCDELYKKGWRVLLTGSNQDALFAKRVLQSAKTFPACAVAQTTFMQLAALVERCSVYVSGDSAPMHIATAMGVPLVALFGPTDPSRHLQAQSDSAIALQKGCQPCYSGKCRMKTHVCMSSINVKDVLAAIEKLAKAE